MTEVERLEDALSRRRGRWRTLLYRCRAWWRRRQSWPTVAAFNRMQSLRTKQGVDT